jgi:hypothetical protein
MTSLVPLALGLAVTAALAAPAGCSRPEARPEGGKAQMSGQIDDGTSAVIAKYLLEKKGWKADQYRLEPKGTDPEGKAIVWAVFLEDEKNPKPGGGESVDLRIDPATRQVVKELRWQ